MCPKGLNSECRGLGLMTRLSVLLMTAVLAGGLAAAAASPAAAQTIRIGDSEGDRTRRVDIGLGKSIVVGRGNYVIMMVGQAPDDNYLRLTVR